MELRHLKDMDRFWTSPPHGGRKDFMMKTTELSKKLLASLFALTLAGAPAIFAPTPVEAHLLSCNQERGIGTRVYNKAVKGHTVHPATGDVAAIQDRLVECNSSRLNLKDNSHRRYLARTVIDESVNYPNAFMAPGGISVVYAKQIEIDRKYDRAARIQDDVERPLDAVNYSAQSVCASTLAHEYGHYANEDFLRMADRHVAMSIALACIPTPASIAVAASAGTAAGNILVIRQESFAAEAGADATALDFLDNVPEYSMGSAITSFRHLQKYLRSTNQKDSGGFRNFIQAHSHTDKRIERIRTHIADVSNGRVQLAEDGRLTVDGNLVCGTGRLMDADRADGRERTDYLAGQIASCMARHIWKPEHLRAMKESEYVRGGSSDHTVFVACENAGASEGYGKIAKVLGTFDYPIGVADRLLTTAQRKAKAELQAVWELTRTLHARMNA